MSDEKKEKVIHTRVPESLDEEIKKRAQRLGTSVSTLIRNALAHTFGLVEDVISDSAEVARSARGEDSAPSWRPAVGQPGAPAPPAEILGWQPLILSVNALCERCNAILPRATEAALAVTDRPTRERVFRCLPCTRDESPNQEPASHDHDDAADE
ncbi:MAG: ribbon-helix-helix protein, CopG family [Myxococcales bacterium]|nr:ribbon-helix-helix protein, CopG family [Myxococcales bacterium]MCB9735839.1 ribbon-helix-helix protein, CopG family [Deltaproteobacteria bacterium]